MMKTKKKLKTNDMVIADVSSISGAINALTEFKKKHGDIDFRTEYLEELITGVALKEDRKGKFAIIA